MMVDKNILTKSDFLLYLEAPLHLWAKAHDRRAPSAPSLYSQLLMKQGYEVEQLAKRFLEAKVAREYPQATISFQAVYRDDGFMARIDALVHDTVHNTYDLYEIKSGTAVKKEYEYDITYQHLILEKLLPLHESYIVHINRDYVKAGELEVEQFFTVVPMKEVVEKRREEVLELREDAYQMLITDKPPDEGSCTTPRSCSCISVCHPQLPLHSIYDFRHGNPRFYQRLLESGSIDMTNAPRELLSAYQRLQVESLDRQQPLINRDAITHELSLLTYPITFLDYETFGSAIPLFDGYTPYQNVVFQFSVHRVESEGATPIHQEFLYTDTGEPSFELVKKLRQAVGEVGSVIVWNKAFECGRNRELMQLQPDYATYLTELNRRTYDLMDIFTKGYYVDWRFLGSVSIKYVLPVLVPEMSYEGMEIGEGTEAMMAWYSLTHDLERQRSPDAAVHNEKLKEDLLAYCKLDTLAMVKIWEKLKSC
jgi:hypothetical protein